MAVLTDGGNVLASEGDKPEEDDQEEARIPKIAARPYTPTKREREEHDATDLPYRSWCKHCVFGKGVHTPHFSSKDDGVSGTISVDYCFMGEEESDDVPGILIMWDHGHDMLWALPVESKGAHQYVVKWIVEMIERAGYGGLPITLKSDNEDSMIVVKRSVAIRRVAATVPIEFPVRE